MPKKRWEIGRNTAAKILRTARQHQKQGKRINATEIHRITGNASPQSTRNVLMYYGLIKPQKPIKKKEFISLLAHRIPKKIKEKAWQAYSGRKFIKIDSKKFIEIINLLFDAKINPKSFRRIAKETGTSLSFVRTLNVETGIIQTRGKRSLDEQTLELIEDLAARKFSPGEIQKQVQEQGLTAGYSTIKGILARETRETKARAESVAEARRLLKKGLSPREIIMIFAQDGKTGITGADIKKLALMK